MKVVDECGVLGTARYVVQMLQDIVDGGIHTILASEPLLSEFSALFREW